MKVLGLEKILNEINWYNNTAESVWQIAVILGFLVLLLAIPVSIVIGIIISIRKKKFIVIPFVVPFVSFIMIILLALYAIPRLHYYKYNDWAIYGSSVEEVRKKYGEFDFEEKESDGSGCVSYYIYDNSFGERQYYYMQFDEKGVIFHIFIYGDYFS